MTHHHSKKRKPMSTYELSPNQRVLYSHYPQLRPPTRPVAHHASPQLTRLSLKNTNFFANTNKHWNDGRFNQSKYIGAVADLASKTMPRSAEEFASFYFATYLSLERFDDLAVAFQKKLASVGMNVTTQRAYDYSFIRIIDETYMSYERHEKMRSLLKAAYPESEGYEVVEPTSWQDRQHGVDWLIFRYGQVLFAIQVKPPKYFPIGELSSYLLTAYKQNAAKHEKFTAATGAPVYYALTDAIEKGVLSLFIHPNYNEADYSFIPPKNRDNQPQTTFADTSL
jgi:hypothetical protein